MLSPSLVVVFSTALAPVSACQPSTGAADALLADRALVDACSRADQCVDLRKRRLAAALLRFPEDVPLHRAYQAVAGVDGLVERYRALVETHPGHAGFLFLYGQALGLTGSRVEALARYQQAAAADPRAPWPHLGLLTVQLSFAPTAATAEALLLLDQCPTDAAVLGTALEVSDPGVAARVARALRQQMQERLDLTLLPRLWEAEFRVAPPAAHEALRAQVRRDLARVRQRRREHDPAWWLVRHAGADRTADTVERDRVEAALAARFPCDDRTPVIDDAWLRVHPQPAADGDWRGYERALLREASARAERCPQSARPAIRRLMAASNLVGELTEAEFDAAARPLLKLWEDPRRRVWTGRSQFTTIARAWLRRGWHLEEIPEMARLGLADLRAALDRQERADPPDRRAARELSWTNGQFDCAALIAEAELRRGRLSEAEHALADMRLDLDDADLERATSFWRLRSDLATRRGRTADAVAFAVRAWRLVPGLAPFQKRVDDAWAAAGLGPEGKAAWDESFADAPGTPSSARWKTVERPLPAFELTDYSGRQWTLADLAGHVVLLNAWATWCGPCKQELPWLERLHERIATRDDVIVLTLNVDENPTLVPAFVQQLGLTVPVLSAADLVTRIGDQGYPATWIVDASGVIRREALGFPPDGEAWMNEALRLLDEVAGRSQTPAGP